MTMIMTRSALEFHGRNPAPEVAYIIADGRGRRVVTWAEVQQEKRDRQARRLQWKRHVDPPRFQPCYVWVFYVGGFVYMGWWCYVVTRRQQYAVNFRGFDWGCAESIMRAVPLGFLPLRENFEPWMEAFAKRYPRPPSEDPRKAGSVVGWFDTDRREFRLDKPETRRRTLSGTD